MSQILYKTQISWGSIICNHKTIGSHLTVETQETKGSGTPPQCSMPAVKKNAGDLQELRGSDLCVILLSEKSEANVEPT